MPSITREYHEPDRPPKRNIEIPTFKKIAAALFIIIILISILYLIANAVKKDTPLSLISSGCSTQPVSNAPIEYPVVSQTHSENFPQATVITPASPTPTPVLIPFNASNGSPSGKLNISIGNYSGNLPVFVDEIFAGSALPGKPVSIAMNEGVHSVKVCAGTICEMTNVHIRYAIGTIVDFEEILKKDAPPGSLSVSIGNYPSDLPVTIDDTAAGIVSPGEMFNKTISPGIHTIKICEDDSCFSKSVEIKSSTLTMLDFEDQLENDVLQGQLIVSIGGFNGVLPVTVDNEPAGNVSISKPLNLKINQGNHSISVCAGVICENETLQIKFGKQSFVDFGSRLVKDVDFTKPTVRIVSSSLDGSTLSVEVEFINPDNKNHSISATISCVYSFTNSQRVRMSDSSKTRVTRTEAAGDRDIQAVILRLPGGSNVIVNDPVVNDIIVT
jgi:hypothetical protein